MPSPIIQILMSSFNGERFIKAQLESLLAQTMDNWQLLIRDDGSTDETLNIIKEYQLNNPTKIKLIVAGIGGDASTSFMSMLAFAEAPYIMFCDQDDVWLPHKVEDAYNEIIKLESVNPVALHFTDMMVVDENLKELAPSFFNKQKLDPAWSENTEYVFAQSIAAGCTMIFTQDLIKKIHPIKAPLFQHDHWMLMHAAYYGITSYSLDKTVLYRQHDSNVVGSHKVNSSYLITKVNTSKKLFSRWAYIKEQFGSDVSIYKLMKAKIAVNKGRV